MKIDLKDKYIKQGVISFFVILCSIIVFFAIYRFDQVREVYNLCIGIISPFIYGLVAAYLLCPVYNFTVRSVYSKLNKRDNRFVKALTFAKFVGSVVALVVLFGVICGLVWMIIPGLMESITKIISVLPSSMDNLTKWVSAKLTESPELYEVIETWIDDFTNNAVGFVTETLLPQYSSLAVYISESIMGVLNLIKNLFVGIIVCVYFLNIKDTFAGQIKKVIVANFKESTAEEILQGAAFTNKTFGGFINGKIIDSLIIGILCFIFMSIFDWEYTLLISCIIGITNVIPFFGPFIGAVPSALLILMVNPMQCVYFLIFILALQQFDGNILGPKILGDSTGLASFWVLFSVIVGGGLFGFVGMVVGIPIFAVIYAYFARSINRKLAKKGFSSDLSDYKVDSYRIENTKSKKGRRLGGKKSEKIND